MLPGGPNIMLCHFRVPLRAPSEEGTAAVTGNGLTLPTRSAAPAGGNRWLISGDPQFKLRPDNTQQQQRRPSRFQQSGRMSEEAGCDPLQLLAGTSLSASAAPAHGSPVKQRALARVRGLLRQREQLSGARAVCYGCRVDTKEERK